MQQFLLYCWIYIIFVELQLDLMVFCIMPHMEECKPMGITSSLYHTKFISAWTYIFYTPVQLQQDSFPCSDAPATTSTKPRTKLNKHATCHECTIKPHVKRLLSMKTKPFNVNVQANMLTTCYYYSSFSASLVIFLSVHKYSRLAAY